MAETSLSTTSNGGTQLTTQSPQVAGNTNNGGGASSGLQPGTASDLLRSSNGVQLKQTPLSTVALGDRTTSSTQTAEQPKGHHINPVLEIFSITLFILAIALFWFTSRSVKNTTD